MTDLTDTDAISEDELEEIEEDEVEPIVMQTIRYNNVTEDLTTSDRLTLFELAHLKCTRVQQIEAGSKIFVDTSGLDRADHIADREVMMRKVPLAVRRQVEIKNGVIYAEELPIKRAIIPDTPTNSM